MKTHTYNGGKLNITTGTGAAFAGHEVAECRRIVRETVYVGKGWKSLFVCPACGRETWQHLNFLGSRKLLCNGVKFSKVKGGTR